MNSSKENRFKRIFVSFLAGFILTAYTGYIVFRKLKYGEVNIDKTDYVITGVCLAIMLAVEAVRYFIRKKSGMKEGADKD